MSESITSHHVTAKDRLTFTLFLSFAINALVILGITFELTDPFKDESPLPTLEVTLVEPNHTQEVEDADYLGQTSQEGGGNTQERVRPSTEKAAPDMNTPIDGDSSFMQEQRIANNHSGQQEILSTYMGDHQVEDQDNPDKEEAEKTTAAQLMMRGKEIARLSAEIQQSMEIYAKKPNERFITSSTKEYRDAAYLDSWRRKVERVGNLNYPEEAKRRSLSGTLVLDVALNPDGTINRIDILRSSGHKLLDDSAVRIVRLASPFAPLTTEMRKDTDILHITRTWMFESGNKLSTKSF